MNRLERGLIRLQTDLTALGLKWALVGGMAVSLRATPRTTADLDIAVAVLSDREAEEAVRGLRFRGYREQATAAVLEQKDVGRLATIRFLVPSDEPSAIGVDLLFASSGVEPEIVAAAEQQAILPGVYLPVATIGHLLALKVLAGRDKDRVDVRSLLEKATLADLHLARETLVLIDRRGFHRGKDLLAELARLQVPEE